MDLVRFLNFSQNVVGVRDIKMTFQADELFYRDYEKMNLILEIMFRKLL